MTAVAGAVCAPVHDHVSAHSTATKYVQKRSADYELLVETSAKISVLCQKKPCTVEDQRRLTALSQDRARLISDFVPSPSVQHRLNFCIGDLKKPTSGIQASYDALLKVLQSKPDPNVCDHDGGLPWHDICARYTLVKTMLGQDAADALITALLDAGADPTLKNALGYNAFYFCTELSFFKLMFNRGYSGEQILNEFCGPVGKQDTVLSYLSKNWLASDELWDFLLSQDADITQRNPDTGERLVHRLVRCELRAQAYVIAVLRRVHTIDPRLLDVSTLAEQPETPLSLALLLGRYKIAAWLIEHGAELSDTAIENFLASTQRGDNAEEGEIAQKIFNDKSDKLRAMLGWAPLHIAARLGIVSYVKEVADKTDPALNAQDNEGNTPLHLAVRHNQVLAAFYLLEGGADLSLTNKSRKPAQPFAPWYGEGEFLDFMLDLYRSKSSPRTRPSVLLSRISMDLHPANWAQFPKTRIARYVLDLQEIKRFLESRNP